MLEIGTKAPDFTLYDKDGNSVSMSDFAGKKVVLYFYPKDNTPGCTRQACAFAGSYEAFFPVLFRIIHKKIQFFSCFISKRHVLSLGMVYNIGIETKKAT